jgi:hypothetical protein
MTFRTVRQQTQRQRRIHGKSSRRVVGVVHHALGKLSGIIHRFLGKLSGVVHRKLSQRRP